MKYKQTHTHNSHSHNNNNIVVLMLIDIENYYNQTRTTTELNKMYAIALLFLRKQLN